VHYWTDIQRLLTFIYVEAARAAQDQDNILLSVDVVFYGTVTKPDVSRHDPANWGAVYVLDGDDIIPFDELPISALPTTVFPSTYGESIAIVPTPTPDLEPETTPNTPHKDIDHRPPLYPVAALGGTFDHLHSGHKILLSMAAWIASEKVIVGVTDAPLLVNKSNADVLQSLEDRMQIVREFGTRFKPSLEYAIVPIVDVYGPTGWDPNIQALVLSHETRDGAAAIASYRKEHNLTPLEPFVIDVISSSSSYLDPEDAAMLKNAKLSSTAIRKWIVEKRAREKGLAVDV